jgi:hypothetical protein
MKVLDLFCGCGGASEGYRQAGLEIAAVADNDQVALDSHQANHPEEPGHGCEHHLIDLSDPTDFIGYWTPGEFDVIHGSPPCTQFSPANNNPDPKKGMELVRSFEEIVATLRPRYFVMENVRTILKYIDGFYPVKRTLNCADYGVPQTRIRAFCGRFPSPTPTHTKNGPRTTLDGQRLERWNGAGTVLRFEGYSKLVSKQCVGGEKGTRATREMDEPSVTVCTNDNGLSVMQFPGGGEPGKGKPGNECRSMSPRPRESTLPGQLTPQYAGCPPAY